MLEICSRYWLCKSILAVQSSPCEGQTCVYGTGDSITAGWGSECTAASRDGFAHANAYDSYGAIAGRVLDAEVRLQAAMGVGLVYNADNSKENTMPVSLRHAYPHRQL